MTDYNISCVIKYNLCTGCGTCESLCPQNAIFMEIKDGIYLPHINKKKCDDCSICFKVCPGHGLDFKRINMELFGKIPENIIAGNYINCYVGYSNNSEIRFNSSSGGLVTEILIFALENNIIDGALVTKMNDKNPFEPEIFIARTSEEIIKASKSKYCPVPANIGLKSILSSQPDEKFAIVGLPCHIHGIRKAEKINKDLKRKIVIHIGLWCSGTCNFYGTSFLLKKLNLKRGEIIEISYRGQGWPGSLKLSLKNKKNKFIPLEKYYDSNFMSFISERCKLCTDCNAELADLSFGDYRGKNAYLNEKHGKSAIISRNILSEEILNKMKKYNKINLKKTTFEDIATLQSYFYSKKKVYACFKIFEILGKKVPKYNQKLIKPSISTYFLELVSLIRLYLASKNLYRALKLFNKITSKFIR